MDFFNVLITQLIIIYIIVLFTYRILIRNSQKWKVLIVYFHQRENPLVREFPTSFLVT